MAIPQSKDGAGVNTMRWDPDARTPLAVPGGDPIMAAKFHPPAVPPWLVVRQRLLQRMSYGVGGPLTLVSAPAGTGKTVLASSWVASSLPPGPVTWISLDEEDAEPGRFWSYVLAGLARNGIPVATVGTPARAETADRSLLARLAACLSANPEPVVLVLDNAEVLTDPRVMDGLDFLLGHADPRLRVVLLTRTDPPFPLPRYRVTGSVHEIRFEHLAFTLAEARALLAAHGVDPAQDVLVALVEHTRGWAAGLRLTARSLPRSPDGAEVAEHPPGTQQDLVDYFTAEVLDRQPTATREFLLRTSIVERFWPGLAVELTGRRDATTRLLAGLARSNMFIAGTADDREGYEYFPIVRDLLRDRLAEEHPGRVGQLHRKAAHWLATSGRLTEAVAHTLATGEWEHAAGLVIDHLAIGELLVGPPDNGLTPMFQTMPGDVDGPAVAMVRSALALADQDAETCAKHLARARTLLRARFADRAPALRLCVATLEMACAQLGGDAHAALSVAEAAEDNLAQVAARGIRVPPDLRTLVLGGKGVALLSLGDLDGASAALTTGLPDADAPHCGYLLVSCLGQLAVIEAVRGNLRRATDLARKAHAAADRIELPPRNRPATVDLALAWVQAEEYDLASARTRAERAANGLANRHDPVSAGLLALVRARLLRARGDVAGAIATIDQAVRTGTAPPWLTEVIVATGAALRATGGTPDPAADPADATTPQSTVVLASVRLAVGDAASARQAVAEFLHQTDLPLDVRVASGLVAATAELAEGKPELARAPLERALSLAATERLRRPVVEAPPQLRRFLRQEHEITERHGWLGAVITGVPETPNRGPATDLGALIVEPLTDKETEVLGYLAALFSTDEIARQMFVSVNTVKTHVRGVLRKLAASRRNEAVRRARELGLV